MHIIVQTPRLIIREFLPGELKAYLRHFKNKEVCLYIPKRSRDERISIFNSALANYSDSKQLGIWGMFDKTDGYCIGSCLLRLFNNTPGIIEIGYSMDRAYWGKGLASEMASAMVAYAFEDKNTKEVVGVTALPNIGSQRVLEKAGLKRMDNIVRDGEELAYFSIQR